MTVRSTAGALLLRGHAPVEWPARRTLENVFVVPTVPWFNSRALLLIVFDHDTFFPKSTTLEIEASDGTRLLSCAEQEALVWRGRWAVRADPTPAVTSVVSSTVRGAEGWEEVDLKSVLSH